MKPGKKIALCLAVALLTLMGVGTALAAGIYTGGSTGYDISYPQCGKAYPNLPFAFGIVGVTSGRAFSQNGCLGSEYLWATQGTIAPSLYMNLNYPIGTTASEGMSGPKGNCSKADKACQAYNYGWNAAKAAYNYASQQQAISFNWWLDIETANSWSAKAALNQQVIQGAIDLLQSKTATVVGIYSTKSMWNKIAGSFAPRLANWVAGASSLATAPTFCSPGYAFGGGSLSLVQYPSGAYSADYACP